MLITKNSICFITELLLFYIYLLTKDLAFLLSKHKKHHEEVDVYNQYSDNLDPIKMTHKLKRATFELKKATTEQEKPI